MRRRRRSLCLIVLLAVASAIGAPAGSSSAAADDGAFGKKVAPFIARHCVRCHGPEKQEGDLKLDGVASAFSALDDDAEDEDFKLWTKILERLATGDMPPANEPRPNSAEQATVVGWIHTALARLGADGELSFPDKGNLVPHELLFGPAAAEGKPWAAPPRLWRISPYQYQALVAAVGGDQYKSNRGFATKTGALPVPFNYRGGQGLQDYSALYQIAEG